MKITPLALPLLAGALCCSGLVHGQTITPCGTDEVRRQLIQQNPDLLRQEAEYELGLQEYLQMKAGLRNDADTVVYVLPIVFHVLYDPTAAGDGHNISDNQVYQAMNVLNRDYAKLNSDTTEICCGFNSITTNARIRFQLATKDPYGNCTNGIDRITTLRSTDAQDFSKLDPWFREHYINIWVVNTLAGDHDFSPAGYSQLPPNVQDPMGALRDGVILLNNYTGDNGTSNPFTSRTLTHELGHFLNLSHTWGNTNAPGVACGDDGVEDTPVTKGHDSCYSTDLYDSFCSWQPVQASYTFQDVTTSSGTTDPTPPPTAHTTTPDELALTFSQPVATGVSANSTQAGSFSFSNWGTGAANGDSLYSQLTGQISTSKYYTFTVTPQTGKSMTLTSIQFKLGRSASGPRTFAVRTSVGGYAANLAAVVAPADTAGLSVQANNVFFIRRDTTGIIYTATVNTPMTGTQTAPPPFLNLNTPVTFRIYAWNAEDTDGDFTVDDLSVVGNYGIIENTQNFMEYSYCSHMFTNGQRDRMRATLNSNVSQRSNLWTDANHLYTGTKGNEVGCAPEADFYTRNQFVCPGTSMQFKANVKRATVTAWSWTFDGGTPATSTLENPTVSFSTPGPHSVSLTVANSYGANTVTKWNGAYVGANYSEAGNPLQEPFNNQNDFNRWAVQNLENNQSYWHWTNAAGHDAPGCAILNASQSYTLIQDMFQPNNFHDIDNLVTPSIAMPFLNGINLSFWYAYSTQTGVPEDITEKLTVYASTNCGKTWMQRLQLTGSQLITAGVRSAGYVPVANEWRQASINLPSLYANEHVRLKFEFTSGRYSNDLFIDDVNINGANVGIAEAAQGGGLGLYPNPASSNLTVVMDLAGASTGTLSFLDMTGRLIHSEQVRAGTERLELDLAKMGLSSGVYFVRLQHANGQRTERLVVR